MRSISGRESLADEAVSSAPVIKSPAIQIATIVETGVQIMAAQSIGEILTVLADVSRWLLSYQRCSLVLVQPGQSEAEIFVHEHGNITRHHTTLDKDFHGIIAHVIKHNQPLRLQTIDQDWLWTSVEMIALAPGARSVFSLPLLTNGTLYGTLTFSTTCSDAYPLDALAIGRLLALQVMGAVRNVQLLDKLDDRENVILSLALAIEAKDPYTQGHCQRLAIYAGQLGELLGFDAQHLAQLRMAAILHDVGKIAVPEHILQKPGPLTDQEFAIMKQHPVTGEAICHPLRSARALLPAIRHHHERWDGRGYPDCLMGDGIPIDARIISIVDAFDAMTSNRPYRQGMSVEQAVRIMRGNSGPQWDPLLLERFIPLVEERPALASAS